jgi:hypothetical protein
VSALEHLDRWRADGAITAGQHLSLSRIVRRERVSLFLELNALLYLGVIALVGGITWTARAYAAQWGDAAILAALGAVLIACGSYVFGHAPRYSKDRVDPPGIAFDYALYLACLVFAVEVGYLEYRFHLLGARWNYYLLASAVLYFLLAYRYDNRFVLSLAIATLGSWFGVRLSSMPVFGAVVARTAGLAYGGVLAGLGMGLHRRDIKRHFLDTYLHIAANVVLAALMSGAVASGAARPAWMLALLVCAGGAVYTGIRFRRFAFLVYGILYGFFGICGEVLRAIGSLTAALAYVVVSAALVIIGLVVVSRRFGSES